MNLARQSKTYLIIQSGVIRMQQMMVRIDSPSLRESFQMFLIIDFVSLSRILIYLYLLLLKGDTLLPSFSLVHTLHCV